MSKADEPAWGERNAVTGYYPQFRLSAEIVIRGLREGSLQWVAIADPKAGRVDDFQVATEQRLDAYQFKWSRYGGNFTFHGLVKSSNGSPSLIEQLADGWTRLRVAYERQHVVVHLATNQNPSTSDHLPAGDPPPEPKHFAAFIEQAWKPAHSATTSDAVRVPSDWLPAWEALRRASKLSDADFNRFVLDCELEFGRRLPEPEGSNRRDAELFENDLDQVANKIFSAIYDPQQIVRLNREELLSRLGWRDRFTYRNQHSFPVNEVLYQPIENSRDALERALNELDRGYVAVLGSPGSGKSTLLTQTLRYFPHRVVRYYAYIPDAQGAALRGEAVNFLYDVVGAIEDAGFRVGKSINQYDREQLRERLHLALDDVLYSWDREGQNQWVRQATSSGKSLADARSEQWSREYLVLGEALGAFDLAARCNITPILIIDEADKLQEQIEDMLLQLLGRGWAHVPRFGDIGIRDGGKWPVVILLSNDIRHDLSPPLRSRCLYSWLEPPTPHEEVRILRARVPAASLQLLGNVVKIINCIRGIGGVTDKPGLRESIDLLTALSKDEPIEWSANLIDEHLCFLGKRVKDRSNLEKGVARLLLAIRSPHPDIDRWIEAAYAETASILEETA